MDITYEELVAEFQKQFPKEFTICAQALQIAKLQQQVQQQVQQQGSGSGTQD